MGTWVHCYGTLPVKDKAELLPAIGDLRELWGDARTYAEAFYYDPGTRELVVALDQGTSWSFSRVIYDAIEAFAAKFASAPAVLECEGEGERWELIVGPEGFDRTQVEVEHNEKKIAELEEENRRLIIARWYPDADAYKRCIAWDVFYIGPYDNPRPYFMRVDQPLYDTAGVPDYALIDSPWFDGDDEALALVHLLALAGEPEALKALDEIGMDP